MSFKIGFEFEFYAGPDRRDLRECAAKEFNAEILLSRNDAPKSYKKWYMMKSNFLHSDRYNSHELVSPIMPLEEGEEVLKRTFAWMDSVRVITDFHCQLDINLSYIDEHRNSLIDPVKLVMFFDRDIPILQKYERRENRRCASVYQFFTDNIDYVQRSYFTNDNRFIEPILTKADLAKHFPNSTDDYNDHLSINLKKLRKNYIEFKHIGNSNYQKKHDMIIPDIKYFCEMMDIASDPEREIENYNQKVKRILIHSLTSAQHHLNKRILLKRETINSRGVQLGNLKNKIEMIKAKSRA